MIEQIKEDLEFSKQWWGSAQEFEPIAQDEIEIVKEMNGHVQYLLDELEKAKQEIKTLRGTNETLVGQMVDEVKLHAKTNGEMFKLRVEHTAMKEALEEISKPYHTNEAIHYRAIAKRAISTLSNKEDTTCTDSTYTEQES